MAPEITHLVIAGDQDPNHQRQMKDQKEGLQWHIENCVQAKAGGPRTS